MLYGTASPLVKFTVLALYWRIFPTTVLRRAIYVLGGVTADWWVAVQLAATFQCGPISKAWDTELKGHCINQLLFYAWNSVPNCALDLLIVILPMREILRLQTSSAQKAGLAGTFLLGELVVVASAVRTWKEWDLIIDGVTNPTSECRSTAIPPGTSADEYRAIRVVLDSIEVCIAIIGACLPTLVPVYRFLFSRRAPPTKAIPGHAPLKSIVTFGRRPSRNPTFFNATELEERGSINQNHSLEALTPHGNANAQRTVVNDGIESGASSCDEVPPYSIRINVR